MVLVMEPNVIVTKKGLFWPRTAKLLSLLKRTKAPSMGGQGHRQGESVGDFDVGALGTIADHDRDQRGWLEARSIVLPHQRHRGINPGMVVKQKCVGCSNHFVPSYFTAIRSFR